MRKPYLYKLHQRGKRLRQILSRTMSVQIKVLTVADLHQSQRLYALLAEAVITHRPDVVALVGDFLDSSGEREGKLTVQQSFRAISQLHCRHIVLVRGNHEALGWDEFVQQGQESDRALYLLHGNCFTCGPLVIVGFPCGMMLDSPPVPDNWLPTLLGRHRDAARALWLMHEPPYGTPPSQRFGPLCGHVEWAAAIERYSPQVVVFGHDHRTPMKRKQWNCRLGTTTCINVGQTLSGPLHYATIEMIFPQDSPCFPESTVVTAYPEAASLIVS